MKTPKLLWLFSTVIAAVIVLDQITKIIATKIAEAPIVIIPDIFRIIYATNKGIIFGFLQNFSWLPIFISVLVILIVVYYYDQLPQTKTGQVLWGLIVGGAVGNLIDRLVQGFVVDFIDFYFWPAFNIADIALTVGIIGLLVYVYRN